MKISGQPLRHLTCAQHQQLGFLWIYEKAVVAAPACDFSKSLLICCTILLTWQLVTKGITLNHQYMILENTRPE